MEKFANRTVFGRGRQEPALERWTQIPDFRGVRVALGSGYNHEAGNRRVSRNGRVSDLPPETPPPSECKIAAQPLARHAVAADPNPNLTLTLTPAQVPVRMGAMVVSPLELRALGAPLKTSEEKLQDPEDDDGARGFTLASTHTMRTRVLLPSQAGSVTCFPFALMRTQQRASHGSLASVCGARGDHNRGVGAPQSTRTWQKTTRTRVGRVRS
jgi:hypothetical protein